MRTVKPLSESRLERSARLEDVSARGAAPAPIPDPARDGPARGRHAPEPARRPTVDPGEAFTQQVYVYMTGAAVVVGVLVGVLLGLIYLASG